MSKPDKLVAMADQIAGFFRSQPGDPADNVADHLKKFWTASMCAALAAHIRSGGEADPITKRAVERLKITAT
jgi:formate dehydrogenase subunit delta